MSHSSLSDSYLAAKDNLYSLFYEITSEIKGTKIELDEREYEDNLRSITFDQLANYLRESIRILLSRKNAPVHHHLNQPTSNANQYEISLRKAEASIRSYIKQLLQYRISKDSLEHKLSEYIEMEEEFEEMKHKLKYEEGKFLDNDRKENEILILRAENAKLKNALSNKDSHILSLTTSLNNKDKVIQALRAKITKTENELNLFSNINININNQDHLTSPRFSHNSTTTCSKSKCSLCVCSNNISEFKTNSANQMKILNVKSIKPRCHKSQKDLASNMNINTYVTKRKHHNRNNSMNLYLDKKHVDLITKYFTNRGRTTRRGWGNTDKVKGCGRQGGKGRRIGIEKKQKKMFEQIQFLCRAVVPNSAKGEMVKMK